MYPAILLNLLVITLFVFIHFLVGSDKKVFTTLSLIAVITGATVLNINYFVQVSVVQPSLLADETEGLALITQFNAHGIFVVLEEFGFTFLVLGFLCATPAFAGSGTAEKAVRWIFTAGFGIMLLSFLAISAWYGEQREYRYEIAVISITWLMLITACLLIGRIFSKHQIR